MGKTKRKQIDYITNKEKVLGDAQVYGDNFRSKKLKPFAKEVRPLKYYARKTDLVSSFQKGVSRYDKLVTKNANRSIKKAKRRQDKNELKETVSENL